MYEQELNSNSEKISIAGNESGMALVTALVLGMLGMLMVATVLFMMNAGTWIGIGQKRYQTSLDAAHGGLQFFAREVIQQALSGSNLSALGSYSGLFTPVVSDSDFRNKLITTGRIGDGTYPNNPATPVDASLVFTLPNMPAINVDMTIGATTLGNSGRSGSSLLTGGVVNGGSGSITPIHIPYLYETEIQARPQTGRENAILTAVYIY